MMKCDTYTMLMQQVLDGVEIGEEERERMREHEAQCATCRAQGKALRSVQTRCARLDDAVEAPEAFRQGWRRAVREEAAARKRRFSPRVMASAAAAVLVVALGGTTLWQWTQSDGAMPESMQMKRTMSSADAGMGMAYGAAYDQSFVANEADGVEEDDTATGEKRIRTANISLRTADFDQVLTQLRALPSQFGGYVSDEDAYGVAGEEARSASMSMRVEASQLDAFLEDVSALGEIRSRSVNTQDVTEAYADVSGRLESAKARRTRLNELIGQAQDISELIELEAALSEVQATIEGYERTLLGWDTRVQYATVYISVRETLSGDAAREGELGLGARIQGALADSLSSLSAFVQSALVFVVAALPWCLAAGAVALAIRIILKLRKKAKK